MMTSKKKFSTQYSGFTLIEVLITVVILSIGLLGMAGIQIQGLRGTTGSAVRSQATILANDIAERIRMNTDGMSVDGNPVNGDYTSISITRDDDGNPTFVCGPQSDDTPTNFPATVCSAVPGGGDVDECSTAQMATFDIYEFACGLGHNGGVVNLLPNGTATIGCNGGGDCGPGSEISITINWTENDTSPGDQFGEEQLKTLTMVIIP